MIVLWFSLVLGAFSLFLGLCVYSYVFGSEIGDFVLWLKTQKIDLFLVRRGGDRELASNEKCRKRSIFRVFRKRKRELPTRDELRGRRRRGGFAVGKENKFSPGIIVSLLLIVVIGGWWLRELAVMTTTGHTDYKDKIPVVTLERPIVVSTPTVPPPVIGAGSP